MEYNITSFILKRDSIKVVCNILEETPEAYKVRIFDVQGCKLNIWTNGDEVTINKSLIKRQ